MTTLSEIDLGAADAESDDRLGEYFVETGYVLEAFTGKKTIFLGRKGAGKTALFKQLPELYREQGRADLLTRTQGRERR
jgi:energy-coupling factor transporter ATP-binding protein EcfA2